MPSVNQRWYRLSLGDAMLAEPRLATLKRDLADIYAAAGNPDSMTAVYRPESSGLHCELVVYLTSGFYQHVDLPDARPCAAPLLSDASLLAGYAG